MTELRQRLESALGGRYTIGREIGRGGMAIVYLCRDLRHGRDVALKVLRPELAVTLGPGRFLQEIRLAAGLAHPNILPLHDSGEADGCLFYVMPFVSGDSLRDRLEREGQLPLVEALAIAREIADALDYAHRAGVIHRDIKPENILLQAGHAVVSDFGIARAISAAESRRMTAVGSTVGTPDYMSPEQAASAGPIDGRSDIYSLGCVLFEMLAGTPPAAFTPPEGPAARPLRPRDRLAELTALRPSVPPAVAGIVARMLEPKPRDRFATGGEAADALARPTGIWTPHSVLARRRRRWGAVVAAGLGTVALVVLPRLANRLEASRYVVVPLDNRTASSAARLGSDHLEWELHKALGRWDDIDLVSSMEVHDLLARREITVPSLADALAIARQAGAGRLVAVQATDITDSEEVWATVWDVAQRRLILEGPHVRVGLDPVDIATKMSAIADTLMLGRFPSRATAGLAGTRSLAAWRAYADGHAALVTWNLGEAARRFRQAVEIDPSFAEASFWLAEALDLNGASPGEWGRFATLAGDAGGGADDRDGLLAQALGLLARSEPSQACDRYDRFTRRYPRDFFGWFGLGECHALDTLVVRDAASPSHWRFRASYQAAIEAYRRALRLVPSSVQSFGGTAYGRLAKLLFVQSYQLRLGYVLTPDTLLMAAVPGLDHDTLSFVPYPLRDVLDATPGTYPASRLEALRHTRALLRQVSLDWVKALPGNPSAHETLALALEAQGSLGEGLPEDASALSAAREGRRLARDAEDALRLAIVETRLLVKLGRFAQARELADSLLRASRDDPLDPERAARLAPLAALTGQVTLASHLLERAAPLDTVMANAALYPHFPRALWETALGLLGYAALGAPRESVSAFHERVEHQLQSWVAPQEVDLARRAMLDEPARFAFFQVGPWSVHRGHAAGNYPLEMEWDLSRGDTAAIRAHFARIDRLRQNRPPGEVAVDATYLEARTLLAIGDTAGAARKLDLTLDALPRLMNSVLDRVPEAAALVRAMTLRARLAGLVGDAGPRRRWAGAVVDLWQAADPVLRYTVDSMRVLAGTN